MACLVRAIRVADSTKYMFFTDEQCWEYVGIRLRFGRKQLCFGEGVVPGTPGCIHACMEQLLHGCMR